MQTNRRFCAVASDGKLSIIPQKRLKTLENMSIWSFKRKGMREVIERNPSFVCKSRLKMKNSDTFYRIRIVLLTCIANPTFIQHFCCNQSN